MGGEGEGAESGRGQRDWWSLIDKLNVDFCIVSAVAVLHLLQSIILEKLIINIKFIYFLFCH